MLLVINGFPKIICMPKCVGGITWPKHSHAQSLFSKTGEDGSYTAQVVPGERGREKSQTGTSVR